MHYVFDICFHFRVFRIKYSKCPLNSNLFYKSNLRGNCCLLILFVDLLSMLLPFHVHLSEFKGLSMFYQFKVFSPVKWHTVQCNRRLMDPPSRRFFIPQLHLLLKPDTKRTICQTRSSVIILSQH